VLGVTPTQSVAGAIVHYNYYLCQELFSFFSKFFPSRHSFWFFALVFRSAVDGRRTGGTSLEECVFPSNGRFRQNLLRLNRKNLGFLA
jgi:hypothetical protein